MEFISTKEAAEKKGCTPQGIWGAIKRGAINGQQIGRSYVVAVDSKFKDWKPNPDKQKAGVESQKA